MCVFIDSNDDEVFIVKYQIEASETLLGLT